ncbi:hypothetical protein ABFS83_06G066800 [Erythranthe nasuta]
MSWSESDDDDWIPGNYFVWFDGDPKNRDKREVKDLKKHAESAIDVYNKTHVENYSFVEIVYAVARVYSGIQSNMMFPATPVSEAEAEADGVDTKPVTFRAHVSIVNKCVEYVVCVGGIYGCAFE